MYNKIRNKIIKHKSLFAIIHFIYTPFRVTKEYCARRKMAKELIAKYSGITKEDNIIFYFGIPEHNNLGDMAQTYCTRKWIIENYPDYKTIEIRTRISFDKLFLNFLSNLLSKEDIFLFQSGYCTRHNNLDHVMHLNIMKKFPDQKAVILPQTVNINSKRDIKATKRVFANCSKLLFISRDHISYEKALEFIDQTRLELYPDIVTSLIGRENITNQKSGILLCMRNDLEKFYTDENIHAVIERLKSKTPRVDITDTNSNIDVWSTYDNLENIISDKINRFSTYEAIITDRYHGTIFSLIANTPVIVVKTNDHKVTSGVDWFKGVFDEESVQLASSLEAAEQLAMRYLDRKLKVDNTDFFYNEYYRRKLRERIEQI